MLSKQKLREIPELLKRGTRVDDAEVLALCKHITEQEALIERMRAALAESERVRKEQEKEFESFRFNAAHADKIVRDELKADCDSLREQLSAARNRSTP